MKKYKYVLFDLDGTLVYSHPGIFACFRYALEKMGRENPTDKQLLPVIGPSLHYSFSTFFGMTDEQRNGLPFCYFSEGGSGMKTARPFPQAVISKKGSQRIRNGHPWVYAEDILLCADGIKNGELIDPAAYLPKEE